MNAQMETKLLSEDWCGVGSAQLKLCSRERQNVLVCGQKLFCIVIIYLQFKEL